jgi:hypothetical protein
MVSPVSNLEVIKARRSNGPAVSALSKRFQSSAVPARGALKFNGRTWRFAASPTTGLAESFGIRPNLPAADIVYDRRRRSGEKDRKTSKVERTA